MNRFKINIFKTVILEDSSPPNPDLQQGAISMMSELIPDNVCNLLIDSVCYIDTQVDNVITTGDIVYNDNQGSNAILGGNRYYKITLSSIEYIVQIDDLGNIIVNSIC